MQAELPADYLPFVVESVAECGENLTIRYGGRVFGGIVRCLLPPGVETSLRAGTQVYVRYHAAETGQPGQIAHMIVRDPQGDGWAEVYNDMQ